MRKLDEEKKLATIAELNGKSLGAARSTLGKRGRE